MNTTRRRDQVIWRSVDERVVGLDLRSSQYFSLNGSAALLWERLADDVDEADLAETLTKKFGIGREEAKADVDRFLAELRQAGLLEE